MRKQGRPPDEPSAASVPCGAGCGGAVACLGPGREPSLAVGSERVRRVRRVRGCESSSWPTRLASPRLAHALHRASSAQRRLSYAVRALCSARQFPFTALASSARNNTPIARRIFVSAAGERLVILPRYRPSTASPARRRRRGKCLDSLHCAAICCDCTDNPCAHDTIRGLALRRPPYTTASAIIPPPLDLLRMRARRSSSA